MISFRLLDLLHMLRGGGVVNTFFYSGSVHKLTNTTRAIKINCKPIIQFRLTYNNLHSKRVNNLCICLWGFQHFHPHLLWNIFMKVKAAN